MLFLAEEFFTKEFMLALIAEATRDMLVLSSPMLIAAIAVGVLVSIFQAATQVQEQTLSFVPKIMATFLSVIMYGAWIAATCVEFTVRIMGHIEKIGPKH